MSVLVDPSDSNYALVNGKLGVAVRLIPADAIKNPAAPTVAEINAVGFGTIVGYATERWGAIDT